MKKIGIISGHFLCRRLAFVFISLLNLIPLSYGAVIEQESIYKKVDIPNDKEAIIGEIDGWGGDTNKLKEAINIAENLLSKNERDAFAYFILAKAYLNIAYIGGDEYNKDAIRALARPAILRALELDGYNSRIKSLAAEIELALGEYSKTEQLIQEAISLDPAEPYSYFVLGIYEGQKKEFIKAEESLKKALDLSKRPGLSAKILNNLGQRAEKKRDFNTAIDYYTRALEIQPQSAWIYNGLGIVYLEQAMYAEAIANFEKALNIMEFGAARYNMAIAYSERGDMYLRQKDYENALIDLNKALEYDPRSAYAFHRLAVVYYEKGLTDKAIECAERAVEIDPGKYKYYNRLAVSYHKRCNEEFEKGRHSAAKIWCDKAIEAYRQSLKFNIDKKTKRKIEEVIKDLSHQNLY